MMEVVVAWIDSQLVRLAGLFTVERPDSQRQVWELPALLACVTVGALLRIWGVGSWGLEFDEETMAMPTMHILKDGTPLLPSGMFYARGIAQLYLMAASVKLLGASEFALRLPSVICGIVLIAISYPFGRRFLGPVTNLCFVLSVTFLPGLIADSQEARMYIFMIASLAAYAVFVFRWESTDRMANLIAAVVIAIIGLQFHVLTIFGSFLLFFPGLLHGDSRKIRQACVAFFILLIGYLLIDRWIEHFYPVHAGGSESALQSQTHRVGLMTMFQVPMRALIAVFAAAGVAWVGARGVLGRKASVAAGILVFLGLCSQLMFAWHLGLVLLALAVIVAWRTGCQAIGFRLAGLVLISGAVWIVQIVLLRLGGIMPARKILGALVGAPSVWPMLRFATYSPVALTLVVVALMQAAWTLMRKKPVADVWLFALLTVWLPLFLLGFFSWDIEPRYAEIALLPALICAFAATQSFARSVADSSGPVRGGVWKVGMIAAASTVLIVNPLALSRVVDAGYTVHPDHKGAAEYIRSLKLSPNDVILAEDVNQQTYYLGHVDYWLISPEVAAAFDERVNGEPRDIYTHTRIMDSASRLQALLNDPGRGAIYVIGSGENQKDGRLQMRGAALDALLRSPRFETVYRGRDGLTRVLRAAAPTELSGLPVKLR